MPKVAKPVKYVENPASTSKKPPKPKKRPVLYEEPIAEMCIGEAALTGDRAKEILDWQEETVAGFGAEYLLLDFNKKKVRCWNNTNNRPLYKSVLEVLTQEILRKRWRFNFEPIIIGKTGLILNGQHTLISLVLACQQWEAEKEEWAEYWETAPTIDKLIGWGCEESDEVVNTLDTAKPRSLTDVFYRSEFFKTSPPKDRKALSRILGYATNTFWQRTGVAHNFGLVNTLSEFVDVVKRHERLLEAVRHLYECDGAKRQITNLLSPGYAAGLLYLMGTGKSDATVYYQSEKPHEKSLNFDLWDQAVTFWTLLAAGAPEFSALRKSLIELGEKDSDASHKDEEHSLIIKGWLAYQAGERINAKALTLKYETRDDVKTLVDHPTVGGIDIAEWREAVDDSDIMEAPAKAPTASAGKMKESPAKKADALIGEIVWIPDEGGHWTGEVQEWYSGPDEIILRIKVDSGKVFEAPMSAILAKNPDATAA